MSLLDQYSITIANNAFVYRVESAIVNAAIAIFNEVANQVDTLASTATGGTFTLSFGGQTTSALNFNATAAQVQAALAALSSIGTGNVVCTGGPLNTSIVITFTGTLGNQALVLPTINSSLTGGTATMTQTTAGVSVVNHTARAALASKVLANPTGYAQQIFAMGVAGAASIITDFPGPAYTLNVSEAQVTTDINNQVSAIWNAYC